MKQLKNDQGYALVIVLLIVVLFMGLAATFMAGSLNHAKQETIVDTGNQAVAAAEMGTIYFSADFERELKLLKEEMQQETQLRLNELIACIEQPLGALCDTQAERDAWENEIDQDMKDQYVLRIQEKSEEFDALKLEGEQTPFTAEQINYKVKSASTTNLNLNKKDVTELTTLDKAVKWVQIQLIVEGESKGNLKELTATFEVEIPDSFLNSTETRKVNTVIIEKDNELSYEKLFSKDKPVISCENLVLAVKNNRAEAPYECLATDKETLASLKTLILKNNLNPVDFRVYTDNYVNFVCSDGGKCNNTDFNGISVVVNQNDIGAPNNMQNLNNAILYIDGTLSAGNNIMHLGSSEQKQTIVVQELMVGNNIKDMEYTNFLVLGFPEEDRLARLSWGQHLEISKLSRLCINIDRIETRDLERLSQEVALSDSGRLIYFTADKDKKFELLDGKGNHRMATVNGKSETMTSIYVTGFNEYSSFLENCGITMKDSKTVPIDVSVPDPIGSGFGLDVEY